MSNVPFDFPINYRGSELFWFLIDSEASEFNKGCIRSRFLWVSRFFGRVSGFFDKGSGFFDRGSRFSDRGSELHFGPSGEGDLG